MRRWPALVLSILVSSSLVAAAGCSVESEADPAEESQQELGFGTFIWPGRSIGNVRLGMSYAQVKARIGPATQAFGQNNVMFALYPARGLEIVFSSSQSTALSEDARVISIGANSAGSFTGFVKPGEARSAIEQRFGQGESVGDTVYYPHGFAAKYASADPTALATAIAVFERYRIETKPAEMRPPFPLWVRNKPLDLGGKSLGIVDMHLHPGRFGRVPGTAKALFANFVPPFLKSHLPAITAEGLDPWAPNLGIRAQTDLAQVDHAVLYAVYTQKTTGFMTNEDVEAIVTDPRNKAPDGLPWAFAFASINFFDGFVRADGTVDALVAARRLSALSRYFERRRDVFIGIKLAHAHQGVAFDDARFLGVYDVAAEHRVPVYLHTGFTPFPGGQNLPAFYDPLGLENTILNQPDVTFVLGHVGQGDARSVNHSLDLAAKHANVYLEISALARPLLVDEDGDPLQPDSTKPQLPWVLEQIKARGLVGKTLYGSDGPQSAGMVKTYTDLVQQTMASAGYTPQEIAAVMGGNFQRVYFPGSP